MHIHPHESRGSISQRKSAAYASFVVSVILLGIKFYAYDLTHSQAILSDALESIINVLTATFVIFVIRYSVKPKDKDHPYGHGKIEYFSSAFEGGLIAFASVAIVIEAGKAWWKGEPLHELGQGLLLLGIAGMVNFALGMYLKYIGKKHKSTALVSSGEHILSDFWTSVGVLIALFFVWLTNIFWLDYLIAILVACYLGWTGYKIVRRSFAGLMDEENLEDLKKLANVFSHCSQKTIIQAHHVKMIRSGNYHHIDAHLVVPEFWNVNDVHEKLQKFERKVLKEYGHSGEINFHLDPCRKAYCKVCDVPECPIRQEPFIEKMPVQLEHLRSFEEPEEFRDS